MNAGVHFGGKLILNIIILRFELGLNSINPPITYFLLFGLPTFLGLLVVRIQPHRQVPPVQLHRPCLVPRTLR